MAQPGKRPKTALPKKPDGKTDGSAYEKMRSEREKKERISRELQCPSCGSKETSRVMVMIEYSIDSRHVLLDLFECNSCGKGIFEDIDEGYKFDVKYVISKADLAKAKRIVNACGTPLKYCMCRAHSLIHETLARAPGYVLIRDALERTPQKTFSRVFESRLVIGRTKGPLSDIKNGKGPYTPELLQDMTLKFGLQRKDRDEITQTEKRRNAALPKKPDGKIDWGAYEKMLNERKKKEMVGRKLRCPSCGSKETRRIMAIEDYDHGFGYVLKDLFECGSCRKGIFDLFDRDTFDFEECFNAYWSYIISESDLERAKRIVGACVTPLDPHCRCEAHVLMRGALEWAPGQTQRALSRVLEVRLVIDKVNGPLSEMKNGKGPYPSEVLQDMTLKLVLLEKQGGKPDRQAD